MTQDDLPTTSPEDPTESETLSPATWWANLPNISDMTGLSPEERVIREKELADLRQATLEAELGLPPTTRYFVRL